MRPFRFSAEAALTLRKKLEDEARVVLTRAQNLAAMADARLAAARGELDAASVALIATQSGGAPIWQIDWHRSWIVKRTREVDACRQQAAIAQRMVAKAAAVVHDAHEKRRVLERLRDRLAERHARDVERHELAQMNELATMRYLIARSEQKEQP